MRDGGSSLTIKTDFFMCTCGMFCGTKRIIICRHGARQSDGQLSNEGRRQSRKLGESLENSKHSIVCIMTSHLKRAVQTGEIVQTHSLPGVPLLSDSCFDEQRFAIGESDWALCLRIQQGLRRLLTISGDVAVVITHSRWIFGCFRLMGLISAGTHFTPVKLASSHHLVLPLLSQDHNVHAGRLPKGWFVEKRLSYDAALKADIPAKVSMVQTMWTERPSHTFGNSVVVYESDNWVVQTDVWNMEKHKNVCDYKVGAWPQMAISKHNMSAGGKPLPCMRDLKKEHLPSLLEIDSRFPDESWLKFILYPPWVYRLHIHIHRRGPCMGPLPCRNVYLLGDVISMVQDGSIQGGDLLVYSF